MDVLDHQGASDARLTVAASRGDDEAFAVLYARYAPRIGAYLHRLLDDEHLAQDLTHEVFVSALSRLRGSRPPIAFGPWLYRIARNASIDVHRRSQLVRQVPLPVPEDESSALAGRLEPEAEAELRQWLDDLRDLLGGLSENHRSVLVLRELEGLSNGEIADRMGVSRSAVEGLLFRARAKVRSEYDDLTSGRRCARVQSAVDRAGKGERLGPRELQLASRHLGSCNQCRRHAWEAGVTELMEQATLRRRALLPAPLLHALGRLSPDHAPLLASPWGRGAAAVTAIAVAGGAVAPRVRDTETASARPQVVVARTATSAPTGEAARRAPALRSPAGVATALPRATAAVPPSAAATPVPAPGAAPPASPSAAATDLPAETHHPAASPERPLMPPAAADAPTQVVPPAATTARTRETVATIMAPVVEAAPQPVAAPLEQATAGVANAVEAVAGAVEDALPPLDIAPLVSDAVGELLAPVAPPAPRIEPVVPALEVPAPPEVREVPAVAPPVG